LVRRFGPDRSAANHMKIGGLEKFSLIDYPDHLSAVVFTVGCTFRCPFCYNPMLVPSGKSKDTSPQGEGEEGQVSTTETGLFHFLSSRKEKLDGVVVTGGEPTMQSDLPDFLGKIKQMGFDVKLDSNGTNPEMIKKLLLEKTVDYLAMDLKCDKGGYEKASGKKFDFGKIEESVKIIMNSGLPYEFRTTCVPGFLDKVALENMGRMINGASRWYLQRFKSDAEMIDKGLVGRPGFSEREMEEFAAIGRKYVKVCEIRG
jgi:pyruvate formate lyase activating enzyme